MPELLSLDIQSPEEGRPRVVDLFGASVRIGRGPQCEVRLQDAALAEVECLLRRRGTTWYVLPQGILGNLAIEGRSVEGLMPLGLGMVLRVGEHRLILRRTQLGPRIVGSFDTPIEIEPRGATGEFPEGDRHSESFARWKSQVEQRDRWMKSRREERRWHARWKAAGQNLPRTEPPKDLETSDIPPVAISPAPSVPPPSTYEPPHATEPEAEDVLGAGPIEETDSATEDPNARMIDEDAPTEPIVAGREDAPTEPIAAERFEGGEPILVSSDLGARAESTFCSHPKFDRAEGSSHPQFVTHISHAQIALESDLFPPREAGEPSDGSVEAGWPSVREVVGQTSSAKPRPVKAAPSRKGAVGPTLGDPIAPATWDLPVWGTIVPAALLLLVMGVVGWNLAWTWGQDDRTAGILADRLLREEAAENDSPLDVADAPPPSWWASTPNHLQLRARAEGRKPSRPESRETVAFLLHTARNAAPLDSAVRLAMATSATATEAVRDDPLGSLGLSNDAYALRQTGRGLLAAKRVDAALRAYREAITMALSIELDRAAMPSFVDDSQMHHFFLPLEETVAELARDLDERVPGGYSVWEKAIPDAAVAQLAVYRLLKKQGRPEQDRVFDRLSASPALGDKTGESLRLASKAEALALKESFADAIKCYQGAIESMPDDVIKRTWQFNLGEICRLSGDTAKMRAAWDDARGPSPRDAINNRLVKAKGRAGLNGRRQDTPDELDSPVPAPFPLNIAR